MREMKDSGIEWIGEIPKHWKIKKPKYIGSIRSGDSVTNKKLNDDIGYEVLGGNGTIGFYDKYNVDGTHIIIGRVGALCGNSRITRGKKFISDNALIYTCFEGQAENYINYIFDAFNLNKLNTSNAQPLITGSKVLNIFIPYPYIIEQKIIADFLDSKCSEIDATAEDIQKEISLLEEYKKSVITEAVTKGLNPDAEMKDSGIEWIGEIPKDWEFPKITHILDYTHPYPIGDGDHGTIKAENYSEEGIPFIRVQNLGFATELIMNNVVYITEKQNNGIINSTLYPNDILFAKTGATIGKVGIMPENIKKANTTSHVGKITVSEEVVPKYIFYVLSSFIGYKQFWDIALMKSTRPELSIDEIKTLHVLLPKTKEEQQQIADFLDSKCSEIDSLIADKKRQLDILADYKKSLIYEYVTGKKEVPVNE